MRLATRWILAFDSDCGSCRRLSARIAEACDNRLETLPLNRLEVSEWRAAALGSNPEWAPTLIRVAAGGVRAWTGRSMMVPLARHLGLRNAIAVTIALGGLRDELAAERTIGRGLSRKRFLQFGAGAAIAGTLAATGSFPAYAADPVGTWAQEQLRKGTLPTSYAEVVKLPMDYRRAVLRTADAKTRSALWVEHLRQMRATIGRLSTQQQAVFTEAQQLVARPSTFDAIAAEPGPEAIAFKDRAIAAFGNQQAAALFATLGPAEDWTTAAPDCTCSVTSDWCGGTCVEVWGDCQTVRGCGNFGLYLCVGRCR